MLHTKFQGHRSIGSGGEDFLRFLPYMGMAPSLSCDPDHLNNFSFLKALRLYMKFAYNRPGSFKGEVV